MAKGVLEKIEGVIGRGFTEGKKNMWTDVWGVGW